MNTKKASVNGVAVEVSVAKTSKAGRRIDMTVTLTNSSQSTPWYGDLGDIVECRVEVHDSNGKAVAPTVCGSNIFGLGDSIVRGQYANMRLEPGTSKSWAPYDLNRCFKFKTGDHELSLTVKFNARGKGPDKPFSITVEKIPFKIE